MVYLYTLQSFHHALPNEGCEVKNCKERIQSFNGYVSCIVNPIPVILGKFDTIHRADLRISDIGNLLGSDWVRVAHELEIADSDINIIKSEYPENNGRFYKVVTLVKHTEASSKASDGRLQLEKYFYGLCDKHSLLGPINDSNAMLSNEIFY